MIRTSINRGPQPPRRVRRWAALLGAALTATAMLAAGQAAPAAAAPLPTADPGWGLEISLDLDAVSAACPTCHIMLVEADSSLSTDLGVSVDTAVRLGAKIISNSFGTDEYSGTAAVAKYWKHPGTSIVAGAGDAGCTTAAFPAVFSSAIAAGGTTLTKAAKTARGWTEEAWSGSGSACSAFIAKPPWQKDTHCLMRTVGDVSAVADPATGFAMYDTYGLIPGEAGFLVAGGTSLSTPLIAAMIARSGRVIGNASWIYAHRAAFYDVVGGSNGYCGGDYLCTGKRGYDAPTGMGTPHGVAGL
jgi:subtilase family serine protease